MHSCSALHLLHYSLRVTFTFSNIVGGRIKWKHMQQVQDGTSSLQVDRHSSSGVPEPLAALCRCTNMHASIACNLPKCVAECRSRVVAHLSQHRIYKKKSHKFVSFASDGAQSLIIRGAPCCSKSTLRNGFFPAGIHSARGCAFSMQEAILKITTALQTLPVSYLSVQSSWIA